MVCAAVVVGFVVVIFVVVVVCISAEDVTAVVVCLVVVVSETGSLTAELVSEISERLSGSAEKLTVTFPVPSTSSKPLTSSIYPMSVYEYPLVKLS